MNDNLKQLNEITEHRIEIAKKIGYAQGINDVLATLNNITGKFPVDTPTMKLVVEWVSQLQVKEE